MVILMMFLLLISVSMVFWLLQAEALFVIRAIDTDAKSYLSQPSMFLPKIKRERI